MGLDKLTDAFGSKIGKLFSEEKHRNCEVLNALHYTFPNRTTVKTYRKRFDAVKKLYPEAEALEADMVEIEKAAKTLNQEAAEKKIRLQERRDRLAAVVRTESGVDITKVRSLFEGLKAGLNTNREAYIAFDIERALGVLKAAIKRLTAENPALYPSDHINYGLNRKCTNIDKVVEYVRSERCEAKVKADARHRAEYEFDSFLAKLGTKVAASGAKTVVSATLGGVWYGTLKVITDIDTQVWFTKTIVNRTKEYHYYNQWPTTLVSCEPLVAITA